MPQLNIKKCFWLFPVLTVFSILSVSTVSAHGEYWNDFIIDNKNDIVESTINNLSEEIADIILSRRPVTMWPDPALNRFRTELIVLQEEVEFMLEHLREEDGIHLQLESTLRENPQAARSVAASHAVEMGLVLIDHLASLEDQYAFEAELHEEGIGAYMFDLMDAYANSMTVYKQLQDSKRLAEDHAAVISAYKSRTFGQDLKYHLGRLMRWMGLDSLAESLMGEQPSPEVSGTP